ncbi:hypothetical protein VNI00_000531 [Paramarasmius palmivorus]|uniref:Uncharacterized protein n=1 Tax=Paramarasmius palmivorus TaxID=297713 RepID=A0AAW0E6E5_9AGAR
MKLGLVASALLLSANAAFAELLSPVSGAVINANDKLNITLKTYHFGRAHTESITAYLLRNDGLCGDLNGDFSTRIVTDFEPNYTWINPSGLSIPSYTTESFNPAGWYAKGDVTLVVEERFSASGPANLATYTTKIQIVD